MIRGLENRVEISGPITMQVAADVFEEARAALSPTTSVVDLGAVTDVDSAGLAVMFALVREAGLLGASLRFDNLPINLLNLAVVYDVAEFLPQH
jgi:phospholipid transport system transporter-binding protein